MLTNNELLPAEPTGILCNIVEITQPKCMAHDIIYYTYIFQPIQNQLLHLFIRRISETLQCK